MSIICTQFLTPLVGNLDAQRNDLGVQSSQRRAFNTSAVVELQPYPKWVWASYHQFYTQNLHTSRRGFHSCRMLEMPREDWRLARASMAAQRYALQSTTQSTITLSQSQFCSAYIRGCKPGQSDHHRLVWSGALSQYRSSSGLFLPQYDSPNA